MRLPSVPFLKNDAWLARHVSNTEIGNLDDCAIAVDATYYLSQLLDFAPAREPLLSALGGLTGIEEHIKESLDLWEKHRITPFFVFDGQSITGQDEITVQRAMAAHEETSKAWEMYMQSKPEDAVELFGASPGAFRLQNLYPLLQSILKQRGLHFLVAPFNACAQLAYFEMINSDQCAGVMGPLELLLYPIADSVIRSFNWANKTVTFLSKKEVMRTLSVSESMFIDAMLMTGTSFLNTFPPLLDTAMYGTFSILEATNLLRTSEKAVASACASYNDMLQAKDPQWHDKYCKARMAVHHFIYITEAGEVVVNDPDCLTKDNHEYLGYQLPAELFHYLNTGLIGARVLNAITHGQMLILPPLDRQISDTYKKLVSSDIIPIKELTLGLIAPRVHRGIGYKDIVLKVWYDPAFNYTLNPRSSNPPPSQRVETWDVKEHDLRQFFPEDFAGPIFLEVLTLANPDFVEKTFSREKPIRGIDSTHMVTSNAIWRFLHLRGYVDDSHTLTKWGNALATSLLAIKDMMDGRSDVPGIEEAVLMAFELIRFGLLKFATSMNDPGLPRKGELEDRKCLMLVGQTCTLLKLRHQVYGYTGPLNRQLLNFRALSSTVREADRDLIEAIVASMFMYGQAKRDRSDHVTISQRLPFSQEPDIALGIAIQTFFEEEEIGETIDRRIQRLETFPGIFLPLAEALEDDFRICCEFVQAINEGVQTLDNASLSSSSKWEWQQTADYLTARAY